MCTLTSKLIQMKHTEHFSRSDEQLGQIILVPDIVFSEILNNGIKIAKQDSGV